ncbi:MAG: hypothetical protein ACRCWL_06490 [Aeromonas sp.]
MVFDPLSEVARLRQQTAIIRKPRFRPSRLDRYRAELIALHQAGASVAELQRWLRGQRIRVVHSTVARWLSKCGGIDGHL